MPRPKRDAPTAVVASAARVLAGRRKNRPRAGGASWQTEAWEMLDTVGELEFYREWVANACSRVTLEAVEVDAAGEAKPTNDPTVLAAMAALFDGDAGQADMLSAMGSHLAVPAETWLCGLVEPSPDPSIDTWRVLSHDEVREQGNKWAIDRGDGEPELYDAEQVYMARIWRPHPRKWVEAHSSVKSALPILRELVGLSRHNASAIDSRLAGNGILAVPSELTFQAVVKAGEEVADPSIDPFMAALIDAMVTPLENPGDASGVVPFVVKGPAAVLKELRHITLSGELSKEARENRKEAIGRLAASLDVPAEVLLGMADTNHWTGWLLDENAIKMHIEPLVQVIVNGLTTRYLWPCLQGEAQGLDPALRRFRIRGDTSELRQRPNRSTEAQTMHAGLTITDAALARETGFEAGDLLLPTGDTAEEYRRRALMRVVATGTADQALIALNALGVTVEAAVDPTTVTVTQQTPTAVPAAPPPAIETRRDVPEPPDQGQASALLAVSELMVLRAVERGWNRAGKRGRDRRPVDAAELDAALGDAWGQVERTAALTGVDAAWLRDTLDTYARELLVTGNAYDPHAFATQLRTARTAYASPQAS